MICKREHHGADAEVRARARAAHMIVTQTSKNATWTPKSSESILGANVEIRHAA